MSAMQGRPFDRDDDFFTARSEGELEYDEYTEEELEIEDELEDDDDEWDEEFGDYEEDYGDGARRRRRQEWE